jgi:hypothetical protein
MTADADAAANSLRPTKPVKLPAKNRGRSRGARHLLPPRMGRLPFSLIYGRALGNRCWSDDVVRESWRVGKESTKREKEGRSGCDGNLLTRAVALDSNALSTLLQYDERGSTTTITTFDSDNPSLS